MKHYTSIYLFLILFSLALHAEELQQPMQLEAKEIKISTENSRELKSPSIGMLIEQVKIAKVEDRRVLMNQLKVQLREMNKESRQKAMRELKKSFSKKGDQHQTQRRHNKEHKNLHQQQSTHQPKYHRLQNGQGMGMGRGSQQGNGRK